MNKKIFQKDNRMQFSRLIITIYLHFYINNKTILRSNVFSFNIKLSSENIAEIQSL